MKAFLFKRRSRVTFAQYGLSVDLIWEQVWSAGERRRKKGEAKDKRQGGRGLDEQKRI